MLTACTKEILQVSLCKTFRRASESKKRVQQRLPRFLSLIFIAQREICNISFVLAVGKVNDADFYHLNFYHI